MTQVQELTAELLSWVGYAEKAKPTGKPYTDAELSDFNKNIGSDNYTVFGKWYGLQGQPWCASFLSYCANRAGIAADIFPKFADCDAGMKWFKVAERWYRYDETAQEGDVVFFGVPGDAQHVGYVLKRENGRLYTVEGNTSPGSVMVPNGGTVAKKSYPLTYPKILGYGRPNYEEEEEMGYETFKEYMKQYEAEQAKLKPRYTGATLVEYENAKTAGVTDGSRPESPATRAEVAIMVYRGINKAAGR